MSYDWGVICDWVGAIMLTLGAFLTLLAALGLVRLSDLLQRMHAAAKPQLLGLLLVAGGAGLSLRTAQWTAILILVVVLQTIATPVGTYMLGRSAYRNGLLLSESLVVDELAEDLAKARAEIASSETPGAETPPT